MERLINSVEQEYIDQQKIICQKYGADFEASPFDKFIGVALNSFNNSIMPVNGLRHPTENKQSVNWYIWSGEYSDSDDFFQPIHISHLVTLCPKVLSYLGLSPGWRFLFDNHYEDVWYDQSLLNLPSGE